MNKIYYLLLLLVAVSTGCKRITDPPKGWKAVETDEYGMHYPDYWKFKNTEIREHAFMISSPLGSDNDQFQENITLDIYELPPFMDMNAFVNDLAQDIRLRNRGDRYVTSARKEAKGVPFHRFNYYMTGREGEMQIEKRCWVENDKAYVLTFTAEEFQFSAYQETIEKMMRSFVVL